MEAYAGRTRLVTVKGGMGGRELRGRTPDLALGWGKHKMCFCLVTAKGRSITNRFGPRSPVILGHHP